MQKDRLETAPNVETSAATGFPAVPHVSEKDLDLNMKSRDPNPTNNQ